MSGTAALAIVDRDVDFGVIEVGNTVTLPLRFSNKGGTLPIAYKIKPNKAVAAVSYC
jgi:hypothetical protein